MFNYAYEKTETQSPGVVFILFYCIFVLLHTPTHTCGFNGAFPPCSTVCRVILHCPAMSSSSSPPLSCWTVDWTPPLSSTSCPCLWCTGESLTGIHSLVDNRYVLLDDDDDPFFFSPRLSRLPGWVSKDGTINLEKAREAVCNVLRLLGVYFNLLQFFMKMCRFICGGKNCFALCLQELKECAGRVFVDAQPEFCLPEVDIPDTSFLHQCYSLC